MDVIEAIKTVAAIIGALGVIVGTIWAVFKFIERQKKQDAELEHIRGEQQMLCYGVAACLDGLTQLGANSNVTEAKNKFSKYLNEAAHRNNE